MTNTNIALSFDDITLIPQYTTLRSRSEADTSCKIWKYDRKTPLISSNMETITGCTMAIAMWNAGGIGTLHRFWSIEDNVRNYLYVIDPNYKFGKNSDQYDCFVSVGVKEEDKERAEKLYEAGARMFVIDIAHGHSIMMEEMMKWMRDKYGESIFIVAGNVATSLGVEDLQWWGADIIKVNVGSGSACSTRKITGHGISSFSCLLECSEVAKVPLIQDGGIRNSGDLVKAIVAGADFAMCGSMFAGCPETPGEDVWDSKLNSYVKLYKGSSSYDRVGIAKEGVETWVKRKKSSKYVVENLTAGLRSGMSYSNARTIQELKLKAKWRQQTFSSELEGRPHILEKDIF